MRRVVPPFTPSPFHPFNSLSRFPPALLLQERQLLPPQRFGRVRIKRNGPLEDRLQDGDRLPPQLDVAALQRDQKWRDGRCPALGQLLGRLGVVGSLEPFDEAL